MKETIWKQKPGEKGKEEKKRRERKKGFRKDFVKKRTKLNKKEKKHEFIGIELSKKSVPKRSWHMPNFKTFEWIRDIVNIVNKVGQHESVYTKNDLIMFCTRSDSIILCKNVVHIGLFSRSG